MSVKDKVVFNGLVLPSYLTLVRIDTPVMPDFEYINNKLVPKEREVTLELLFDKQGMINKNQERELLNWVKGDDFKPSKLVLYQDKSKYYLAKLKSKINISGLKRGKLNIDFICENPFKHSEKKFVNNVNNNTISYSGDEPVYPDIQFQVTAACTKLELTIKNDNYNNSIILNGSFNANDVIKINQNTNKVTINDNVRMGVWDLRSKRHKLCYGTNVYKLITGNANVNIEYQELYN